MSPAVRRLIRAVDGVELAGASAASARQGPLRLVEVTLTLENPTEAIAEADLDLRVPVGARIARLALRVAGRLREAVVVPRDVGVDIYEAIVAARRDPALLERDDGAALRLRVAPIPALERAQVVFSFIDLAGPRERAVAARDGGRWIARVPLPEPPAAATPRRLRVLLDTSASMQPHFPAHLARARELLAVLAGAWGPAVALELVAFDQEIVVVHDGPLAPLPEDLWRRLAERGAFGATRMAAALGQPSSADRVIVLGDAATQDDAEALAKATAALSARRLDVVAWPPPAEDPPTLAVLRDRVRAALPEGGVVDDRGRSPARLGVRLTREAVTGHTIEIPGATWWWPRSIAEANVDAPLVIAAESTAELELVLRDPRGEATSLPIAAEEAAGPLFDRLWQALRVDAYADSSGLDREELARRAAELGVLTRLTAMLALESDEDERRYGVVRRAGAPILTIEGGEVILRPPGPRRWSGDLRLRGDAPSSFVGGDAAGSGAPSMQLERSRRTLALGPSPRELALQRAIEGLRVIEAILDAASSATPLDRAALQGDLTGTLAELDAALRGAEAALDERDAELLAALRAHADAAVAADDDARRRCHVAALREALRIESPPRRQRTGPWEGIDEVAAPREDLTPASAVRLARDLDAAGRHGDAVRALGSIVDLQGLLPGAAALAVHPEGRALAIALLRERLAGVGDPASTTAPTRRRPAPPLVLHDPEQVHARRLLAGALADDGAFAGAFELLAAPLRESTSIRPRELHPRAEVVAALFAVARDLRLIGARWASREPAARPSVDRTVRALAGRPMALLLQEPDFKRPGAPLRERLAIAVHLPGAPAEVRLIDPWGAPLVARSDRDDDGFATLHFFLDPPHLPAAIDVRGGAPGEWVRIDLTEATGSILTTRSELVPLVGPRTRVEMPAAIQARAGCRAPAPGPSP